MSITFSRAMLRRPTNNNLKAVIRRSIARSESTTISQTTATTSSKTTTNTTSTAQTTTEATKQKTASITAKASENLGRAASVAGPALSSAAKGLGKTLGSFGGQTGQLISFIQRQIPSTIYYARVGVELSKLVFHGQKMAPPPMSTFQSYYQRAFEIIRKPNSILNFLSISNTKQIIEYARNLSNHELAAGAVLFAEVLGFFTVGEMIGRFKLIGYRGKPAHHH